MTLLIYIEPKWTLFGNSLPIAQKKINVLFTGNKRTERERGKDGITANFSQSRDSLGHFHVCIQKCTRIN